MHLKVSARNFNILLDEKRFLGLDEKVVVVRLNAIKIYDKRPQKMTQPFFFQNHVY